MRGAGFASSAGERGWGDWAVAGGRGGEEGTFRKKKEKKRTFVHHSTPTRVRVGWVEVQGASVRLPLWRYEGAMRDASYRYSREAAGRKRGCDDSATATKGPPAHRTSRTLCSSRLQQRARSKKKIKKKTRRSRGRRTPKAVGSGIGWYTAREYPRPTPTPLPSLSVPPLSATPGTIHTTARRNKPECARQNERSSRHIGGTGFARMSWHVSSVTLAVFQGGKTKKRASIGVRRGKGETQPFG